MVKEKCKCGHIKDRHPTDLNGNSSCIADKAWSRCSCKKWEPLELLTPVSSILRGGAAVTTTFTCSGCLGTKAETGTQDVTNIPQQWSAIALGPINTSNKAVSRRDISWGLLCSECRAKIDELLGIQGEPKRRAFDI